MKEEIKLLYDINERYHDKKEEMAWVAASLYFTFSIAIFLNFKNQALCITQKITLTVFLSIIYFCLITYINLQFRCRWDSVDKSFYLLKEIEKLINSTEISDDYLFDINHSKSTSRNTGEIFLLSILFPIFVAVFLILGIIKMITYLFYKIYYGIWKVCKKQIPKKNEIISRICEYSIRSSNTFDSRYRSEIPAYSLSLYFLIGQLIIIWFPIIIYQV